MTCLMEPLPTELRPTTRLARTPPWLAPNPDVATGRVHALVCADARWTGEWLRHSLEAQGYEVCGTTTDGAEALSLALTTFPDVVLTDLRLPGLSGIELTRRLMAALPTPVVVLAGPRDGIALQHALQAGAVGYLVKPFAEERLRPAIEGAMRIFADTILSR
jgi:CheY-like chemotaxis protein